MYGLTRSTAQLSQRLQSAWGVLGGEAHPLGKSIVLCLVQKSHDGWSLDYRCWEVAPSSKTRGSPPSVRLDP